ncbi:MAG: hypothetical protein ACRD8Z_08380 [Nitrososphaeraceae archaeon]
MPIIDSRNSQKMVVGGGGDLEGQFDNSHSVDVDSLANIYVSDKDNH